MPHTHDVIVIGAGSAGLTAAGGCAMFGLKPLLIERGAMGGDCLNTGCVPSKAIITAAHQAHLVRQGGFGVTAQPPMVDFAAVRGHIHGSIKTIEPHDSVERFEAMGVEVVQGEARFVDPRTIAVGDVRYSAPRIVLAVGSRAMVPPITGIENVPFLTNETLWELDILPDHLLIIGGGAIGMEMAQAFRRLGSKVSLTTTSRPLPRDDEEAAAIVVQQLRAEGVTIITDSKAESVSKSGDQITLNLADGTTLQGSHLLIAAGRSVNFDSLALDKAGVTHDRGGIVVDDRRRTNQKHIYAIGDCRAGPRFTHSSGYEGGNVALEISLGLPTKVNYAALPWATYCDPELGQVGLTEAEARAKHGDKISVWREDFDHNDRAVTEGDVAGFVKLVKLGGKVIGGTVVGRGAGDLIMPIAMMIAGKASSFGVASMILPYPNRSEHIKAAAFASHESQVFNGLSRGWARFLARLRR